MNTTNKKYCTFVADPPWDINQRGNHGASEHYDLMKFEAIKSMPIEEFIAESAHLYLWCPNGLLKEGLEVVSSWGFQYRCSLVWCKPRISLGRFIRTAHETLLFATHGKAPVKFHGQPSWLFAAQQEHSHKPEEIFSIIERLSHPPYLELFARRRQPGWDCWGFEAPGGSDIIIPVYPVPKYSEKVINPEKSAKRKRS